MAKLKLKTHTGASKRLKKTSSGKVKFAAAGKRHLMTGKSAKSKRHMRRSRYAIPGDAQRVAHILA